MLSRRTLIALVPAISAGLGSATAQAGPLSRYRWQNRPLLVFAPTASTPALREQRALIAASDAGVIERDMVVIIVAGDSVETQFGGRVAASASTLRRRYGVSSDAFRVLLVGKDGGVKLTRTSPTAMSAIFRLIDAMPMRRDEMRQRGS